jgi:hypothetical protein
MFAHSLTAGLRLTVLALGGLVGLTPAAEAFPSEVVLLDVTFSDGGTASGAFTLNLSGYLANPTSVVTTSGSVLGGANYDLAGPFSKTATTVDFTLPSPPEAGAYEAGLSLVFALPLGSVEFDPIVGGCEFTAYSCSGQNFREVTGGLGVIPEPGSMALVSAGLVALGAVRRRVNQRED